MATGVKKIYKVGAVVTHWKFGKGMIVKYKYDETYARWLVDIAFLDPEHGTKTFFAEVPYLTKEDIPKLKLKE